MAKKCKPFEVQNVNLDLKEKILKGLKNSGAEIEGDNPWIVDLNQAGVVIEAKWDSIKEVLRVTVLRRNFLAGCKKIEKKIRKAIQESRNDLFASDPFNFDKSS